MGRLGAAGAAAAAVAVEAGASATVNRSVQWAAERLSHAAISAYATGMATAASPGGQRTIDFLQGYIEGASPGSPQSWSEFAGFLAGEAQRELQKP